MTHAAHTISYNIQKALRYREHIVISLIAAMVFFAGTYIYFIREAIVNVVARQQVTKEIQTDNASISTLENQYFNLKSSITMNTATNMGFAPVAVSAFIPATPSVAISSNDEI